MSNETKQTALQWYVKRLYDLEMAYNQGLIKTNTYINGKREAVEQAKEMEKKQHSNTWFESRVEMMDDNYIGKEKTFDEFYNETYGDNK
jgi:hypothetical protein